MVLAIDESVLRGQRRVIGREMLQPVQMRRAPVGAVAKDESALRKEFEDVVPRLEDLALKRLPAAHDVTDPFVRFARDAHRDEFPGTVEPRQVGGITLVMLPVDARPLRNQ